MRFGSLALWRDRMKQFKGQLSLPQIAEGMNCATINAGRLAEDARTLLDAGRYPTAFSIAALSIEESGKVVILRRLITSSVEKDVLGVWKEYRTHTKKNLNWILPDLVAGGARRLDDFKPMFAPDAEHPLLLDQIKQLGFYTDCLGKAHWSVPVDVIDQALAERLVSAAEVISPKREVSVLELELWAKHMRPVWKRGDERMRVALANWYADMQESGLMPKVENKMAQFIRTGLSQKQASKLGGDSA